MTQQGITSGVHPRLAGSVAVVTGAGSGIGRATALAFGEAGADLALIDYDQVGLDSVSKSLDGAGVRISPFCADLADVRQVKQAIADIADQYGRLDALANVAGIYPRAKVGEVTEEHWERVIAVNLRSVFFSCQAALAIMNDQGRGSIVNVASGAAFRPIEGLAVYSASKAGLVGMTRVLAYEYARRGIRINVVAPGHTTSMFGPGGVHDVSEEAVIAEALVPGRLMTPEESAQVIVWLCTESASGLNGAIINVNGGNHMPQG